MDVILFNRLIIGVFTTISILVTSTTTLDARLLTYDGTYECTRELQSISLTPLNSQLLGQPGPRGDKGITGSRGDQGIKGEVGPSGLQGEKGSQGPSGQMGPEGMKGEKGSEGIKGVRGSDGEKGEPGTEGPAGEEGDRGDDDIGPPGPPGAPGLVGLPGSNGHSGTCACINDYDDDDDEDEDKDTFVIGTREKPAEKTCKFFEPHQKRDTYYLKDPSGQIMEVYCNMETLETCLVSKTNSTKYFYTAMKSEENKAKNLTKEGPFWLSDRIEMKNLYGVTEAQIKWLRKLSSSVKQTLRYHCNNSVPYSRSNITSSVYLLTWNDVVIGPYPSDETPFFYSVPEETNHCDKLNETEIYSDIVLHSTNVYRLPIIDIQIRDIRDELQMFYIEPLELCFR